MDLGELIARDLIKGFSDFKPKTISFQGENLRLIYSCKEFLEKLQPQILVYGKERKSTYIINIDELIKYYKKRKSGEEISFRSYWGEDIPFEPEIARKFFVSNALLNPERDVIYRKIAKTRGGALKVIPYKRKGEELIPLAEIYLMEKQHLSDMEF